MEDVDTTVEDADLELEGSVTLRGSDCEICGYTDDLLTWNYYGDVICMQLTVGCRHVENFETASVDHAVDFLNDLATRWPDEAGHLAMAAAHLRALATSKSA